jgi:hypothetical protein
MKLSNVDSGRVPSEYPEGEGEVAGPQASGRVVRTGDEIDIHGTKSNIPHWILVAMVTDHTRSFPDVPEPNCAIL